MKKNILIVNNTLGDGGAEKILIDILENLNLDNYNIKLLILNKKGVRKNEIRKGIKIKYIYPDFKFKSKVLTSAWNCFKYRSFKHLYKVIYYLYAGKNNEIEIAFLEGETTRFVSKSINKNSKKIAWVHTDLQECRPKEINEADKGVYKNFDRVVCVSESSKKSFQKIYNFRNDRVTVIYNFVDSKKVKVLAEEEVLENLSGNVVAAVGRLTKIKGFMNLVKAANILKERGISFKVFIVGMGEDYGKLQEAIKKFELEDYVKLIGFKKNPYPYIKNAKICAITSEFEGGPLVMAEAMTMGKAIISTNYESAKELLENGKNGILVNINDELSLANEIENLILDSNKMKYFENLAYERSRIFEYKEFEKKLEKILK